MGEASLEPRIFLVCLLFTLGLASAAAPDWPTLVPRLPLLRAQVEGLCSQVAASVARHVILAGFTQHRLRAERTVWNRRGTETGTPPLRGPLEASKQRRAPTGDDENRFWEDLGRTSASRDSLR